MKISQSLLLAYATAQPQSIGQDKWASTDYYSFNYGFGGKQDGGTAFGMVDNPAVSGYDGITGIAAADSLEYAYGFNSASAHHRDNLHYNGLLCWMCDFRLDLATEAETEACSDTSCQNAYARCLKGGMLMRCRGEQRTCMFEERRRHGVVYSVCTGCKQTDACVAHWRRNQRFTLPFMNFGDMSLRNLPTSTSNLPIDSMDQLPNHRPIYVDDECSTFQETRTEAAWRSTAYVGAPNYGDETNSNGSGTNNEVYPMGWVPLEMAGPVAGVRGTNGKAFSSDGTALQFTGHRVNLGLSYSRFAYDGANNLQLNAQLSQWESTCRWCCHARPDTVCNIEMKTINSSPFATKCGNNMGTRRDAVTNITNPATISKAIHPMATILAELQTRITDAATTAALDSANQFGYWQLITNTDAASVTMSINNEATNDINTIPDNTCCLSNAQWSTNADSTIVAANKENYPQGIHLKFRFFQPFNIAQSNADFYNTVASPAEYQIGPRFWMQMFQRTPQYDLSAWYGAGNAFTAKFPAVGEGRNSAGMDKFAGRGNMSRWQAANREAMNNNSELQHFFEHQTDMVSQENRDFFDGRAKDAKTAVASGNMYLRRYDNDAFWNSN